jgi:hypothetical protein
MDEEVKFYTKIVICVTVFLIVLTVCITCKSAYKDYLKVKAVTSGADPIYVKNMFSNQ